MNLLKNTVVGMIIIIFLVASAYGLYYAFQFLVNAFTGVETVQKTLLVSGAFTLLLSAAMITAPLAGACKTAGCRKRSWSPTAT